METIVPNPDWKDVNLDGNKKDDNRKRQKPRKKRSKKGPDLSCPMKILESVLSTANYKVPNLSQEVERKFYHTADYSKELARLLEDVVYFPTVGEVNETQSDVPISVFPRDFDGQVNVPPGAIMSLTCINEEPKKRLKWRRGKGNKGKVKDSNVKDDEKNGKQEKINNKEEDVNNKKEKAYSKNEVEEIEINQVNIKQITNDNTDLNKAFNGQLQIEGVDGNGKKKKKKRKNTIRIPYVPWNGNNIKTNGEV